MAEANPNGNGRLTASLEAVALRDRLLLGVGAALLAILSFLGRDIYARLGTVELLLRDLMSVSSFSEKRWSEDHILLLAIEAARQQRTVELTEIRDRLGRLETRVNVRAPAALLPPSEY